MTRLSAGQLGVLAGELGSRDREVLAVVRRFRLASGKQLERLMWPGPADATRARLARHGLARLQRRGLLERLDRRIGGIRAGSAGSVFTLSASGQRMASLLAGRGATRGRTPYEPGTQYVRHTLGVVETYVRLVEAERLGKLELLDFAAEPQCWRTYSGRGGARLMLKPDALACIGVGAYEDRYFLEIDCGTEGRGTLMRKVRAYVSYFRTGVEQHEYGVFPRVLWITGSEKRKALLVDVCSGLPADTWQIFAIATVEEALPLIRSGIGEPS